MLKRITCSILLVGLSPLSWGIEEVLVTGTRPSGPDWKPWGSNNYTELTQLNQNGASGYVAYHRRQQACQQAASDIEMHHRRCMLEAERQYKNAADNCPLDAELTVSLPGFVSATTTPRATCLQQVETTRSVARSQCNYNKAVSKSRYTRECS
jgi:hypothetical protein